MCAPKGPEPEKVQKLMERRVAGMARYLCGSQNPCEKHARQAKDLWLMAVESLVVPETPPPVPEPSTPSLPERISLDDMERSCASKTRYGSPEHAGRAAATARDQRGVTNLRVYPCGYCGGFHLTKASLETFASR